jgi:hypothetical protein
LNNIFIFLVRFKQKKITTVIFFVVWKEKDKRNEGSGKDNETVYISHKD